MNTETRSINYVNLFLNLLLHATFHGPKFIFIGLMLSTMTKLFSYPSIDIAFNFYTIGSIVMVVQLITAYFVRNRNCCGNIYKLE